MNNWKYKFYTIWTGQAVSVLTSAILQMALIWHLTATTKSAAILSIASIAGFLPTALLSAFAGVWVDRLSRKVVIICADMFIAFISLILAIYALFGELPVWLILVVLFLRSIGTAFHSPAISAITPMLVPEEMLTKCAGMIQSFQMLGYIGGAAIAGVLYPIWSISGLVMIDVIGAIVASLTVAIIKIPNPKRVINNEQRHILHEMKEGYDILKKNKGLFALLWIGTIFMILYSPINALFPLVSIDYFGGTTTHAAIAEITFSIGMVLGGILLGIWGGFKNRAISMVGALVLMGVMILITGLLPVNGFILFAIICVFMGISSPFYTGPEMALFQERIAPEYLGRVYGIYGSITGFAMPVGLMISGLFADKTGVMAWFVITGIAVLVLSVITWSLSSVRNIELEHNSKEKDNES